MSEKTKKQLGQERTQELAEKQSLEEQLLLERLSKGGKK